MHYACSNHCAERWRERYGGVSMDLLDAKRAVLQLIEESRPASIEEAAMIRASSKGAAFLAHDSTEYRISGDDCVFVVGPGRLEPGARVAVTCFPAAYLRREAA